MAEVSAVSPASPPTVLVVDDNETIADTYAAFLEGYEVRTAYSGRGALSVLDSAVDVVLLDRRLPDMRGETVLSRIDDRPLDCRVVLVTGVEPTGDIVDMPVDEYLRKPADRAAITAVVDEMVRRSAYDDDLRRFLALASKKATLEATADGPGPADSEEYERVRRRLAERRAEFGVETTGLEAVVAGTAPDIAGEGDPPTATGE
jgi:DNA-binding response OmpR family regulator